MEYCVEFSHIEKAFPGVRALKDISFSVRGGRVTSLLGENGAGKSTLLKILSGDLRQDEGKLIINGEEKRFHNPKNAIDAGVSVIYQERQLMPLMTVMENIFLEDLPKTKAGFIKRGELKKKAQEIIDKFGLPIDPEEKVGHLSVAYQQMVEIMKAYRRDSMIIAFDEPTASLTDTEVSILFNLIRQLKEEGKVIFYVSHRLAEIFQITDDIVVLKDGALVGVAQTSEMNDESLIKMMVGRDIGDTYANLVRNDHVGDVLLEVRNLETDVVHDVSFSVHSGEVLGFAGLVGSGRTEVVRAIFGADPIKSGTILLKGQEVSFKTPHDAIEAGIALCPEDRKEQGLVLGRSIKDNISIPVLDSVSDGLFLNKKREAELVEASVKEYSIRTPTIEKIAAELSGGNQQKVILGRWTSREINIDVLILDEPTKGIDVGTKAEIYQRICNYAREGKAVIFISSELTEVLNVSDRIIVMHNGHITGIKSRDEATEENIMALAMLD